MKKSDNILLSSLNNSFKDLYNSGFEVHEVALPLKKLKQLRCIEFINNDFSGKYNEVSVSLNIGKKTMFIVSRI